MHTVLARATAGGHRATPRWTRHAVRYTNGGSSVCGAHTLLHVNATVDSPSAQGAIRNCKRCLALTEPLLWEGKVTR